MADPEPAACKVLRKFLPRLAKTLDPSDIATNLYSLEIIDARIWEEARKSSQGANYDRCLTVLEALIRSVRAKPDCFDKFCSILEEEEVWKPLSTQLKEELEKVKEEAKQPLKGEVNTTRKRKRDHRIEQEHFKKCPKIVKPGTISDHQRLFKDLAMDISDKYEEVGLELGLPYNVLRSELESGVYMMYPGHKKATRMLHLWRESCDKENFSYSVLAAALEKHGLQRCAQEYCYTTDNYYEQ